MFFLALLSISLIDTFGNNGETSCIIFFSLYILILSLPDCSVLLLWSGIEGPVSLLCFSLNDIGPSHAMP